jgi:hypothetical protein
MPHNAGDTGALAWANGVDTGLAGKLDSTVASSTYGLPFNVFNLRSHHLLRTRAGLARAKAGTGTWSVGMAGDSTTAGIGATPGVTGWPEQFQQMLAARGYPSASVLKCAYTNATDPRVTIGAGWNSGVYNSNLLTNVGTTNPFTIAYLTASTQVKVWYMHGGAATFNVTIDGGAPTLVTVTLTDNAIVAWDSGALPSGNHTVSVAWASGSVFLYGIENVTSDTAGVRLCNAAVGGVPMAFQAGYTPPGASFEVTNALVGAGFLADTAFLFSIANDVGTTNVAAWQASLATAITNLKATGSDVILGTALPVNGYDLTPYIAAIKAQALLSDVPVIDFAGRWDNSWAIANTAGLMFDIAHGTAAGYGDFAQAMIDGLGLGAAGSPAPTLFTAPTLAGTWANLNAGYGTAGYMKHPDGTVELQGVIAGGTMNTPAFTLPVGFRPGAVRIFITSTYGSYGQLNIDGSGVVTPASGSATWFSLDGVRFTPEQ